MHYALAIILMAILAISCGSHSVSDKHRQ